MNSLLGKTKRFGELQKELNNINPRTLSKRLQDLEKQGYIKKKIYPQVPLKVEYSLTKRAEVFKQVVKAVRTCEEKM